MFSAQIFPNYKNFAKQTTLISYNKNVFLLYEHARLGSEKASLLENQTMYSKIIYCQQ